MLTQKERRELRYQIKNNQHQLYVISFDEMDAIIRSSIKYETIKETWKPVREKAMVGANYGAAGADSIILAKLIGDLGGVATKVVIKSYNGKPHIIIKGRPGLRKVLTGTKYGITHPKVISMGLGRAAVKGMIKKGGVLTVVLLTGFRIVDHVLTDQSTLSRLIGTIATDVVKVGFAVGASLVGAAVGAFSALAIGPLAVAIIVGVITTIVLDKIDNHYGLTEKVIKGIEELSDSPRQIEQVIKLKKQQLNRATSRAADTVFDYIIDQGQRVLINFARHSLNKLLNPALR